jgi:hypothetical protein
MVHLKERMKVWPYINARQSLQFLSERPYKVYGEGLERLKLDWSATRIVHSKKDKA